MKIVLNKCYGGFSISDECAEKICVNKYDTSEEVRTNLALITAVLENPRLASGMFSALRVVTIPDEATDYEIDEYDGHERITYVLDGKLHHI